MDVANDVSIVVLELVEGRLLITTYAGIIFSIMQGIIVDQHFVNRQRGNTSKDH